MNTSSRLNQSLLGALPAGISRPQYQRDRLQPGIVHLGLGNFHRSHQALYLDDLFQQGGSQEWGICGVGLLPQDSKMAEALLPQDYLYTLVERDSQQETMRVVGSLCGYLHAPSDPAAVLARLTDAQTKIVSLTVTEGGYYLNQGSGELDHEHPNLRHDLEHPEQAPVSVYGYLSTALEQRKAAGKAPFTIMSCDNLQSNGDIVRRMLTRFAHLRDPQLGAWIESNVAFPNCMVDRITPATTDTLRAYVQQQFGGVEDAWPVLGETFRQWVIEDKFSQGRPAFEKAGVQITSDVHPYELMKIRMLNASHQALCHLGVLLGYETTDKAMQDQHIPALLNRYLDTVRELIPEPPGVNLANYQQTLLQRYANPAIKDQLARICFDASSRIPKFVLPSAREQLARGAPVNVFAFVVACWIRYLGGQDDAGARIEVQDPLRDLLLSKVGYGTVDPLPLLQVSQLFGSDLAQAEPFVQAVRTTLESLHQKGARATVADFLGT
ncbi:MAG: mannitol dehydrogenase family protein [Candidatus Competibacteraceae bacterium]|nr:mannitol dehydrogenase family protein [Candidatus Competibacteraceae bacterium]